MRFFLFLLTLLHGWTVSQQQKCVFKQLIEAVLPSRLLADDNDFFFLPDLVVASIIIIYVWTSSWTRTYNSDLLFFHRSQSLVLVVKDEVRIRMREGREKWERRRRRWWWWREREKNNIRDMQTRLIRRESSGILWRVHQCSN